MKTNRDLSMDALRGFAAITIVLLHCCAEYTYNNVGSLAWSIAIIIDGLTRWAVPVFVMISGAFLLNREISLKELWCKRIFHLAYLIVFWNFGYYVIMNRCLPSHINNIFFPSTCQMWFLYMLIGIYAMIPLLKPIVNAHKDIYFLSIWFVIEIFFNTFNFEVAYIERFQFLTFRYAGYFILGNYLYNLKNIPTNIVVLISILASIGTFVFIIENLNQSFVDKNLSSFNLLLYVFLQSVFVFLLFKKYFRCNKLKSFIKNFSTYSLGIYLLHVGWIYIVRLFFITNITFIDIILTWILASLFSYIMVSVMYRIPLISNLVR